MSFVALGPTGAGPTRQAPPGNLFGASSIRPANRLVPSHTGQGNAVACMSGALLVPFLHGRDGMTGLILIEASPEQIL